MFRWHIGFYSSQGWNNVVGFWQWRWKEMKRCKRYFGQIERSRWWAKYERQYRRSSNGGWVLGWWLNETFPRGREHRRRPQPCMPCFSLRKSFQLLSLGLVPCMKGHQWSVSFLWKVTSVTPNETRFFKTKARRGDCLMQHLFLVYYTNASEQRHIKASLNWGREITGRKKDTRYGKNQ